MQYSPKSLNGYILTTSHNRLYTAAHKGKKENTV